MPCGGGQHWKALLRASRRPLTRRSPPGQQPPPPHTPLPGACPLTDPGEDSIHRHQLGIAAGHKAPQLRHDGSQARRAQDGALASRVGACAAACEGHRAARSRGVSSSRRGVGSSRPGVRLSWPGAGSSRPSAWLGAALLPTCEQQRARLAGPPQLQVVWLDVLGAAQEELRAPRPRQPKQRRMRRAVLRAGPGRQASSEAPLGAGAGLGRRPR